MKKKFFIGIITFIIAFTSILCASQSFAAQKYLTIKGSDTMVLLVNAWAESFMKSNHAVNISVNGGGSGIGISALINKTTDIASASREMKPQEIQQAKQNGVNPKQIVVARDAISIVVNPKNPVKQLSIEQLKKIYTGVYTNWNQVGGINKKITVLSRESSSGTYVFFQEHVLNKQDYAPTTRLMPTTSAIIMSVSSDAGTIGYVGLGYALGAKNKVKIVKVNKGSGSPAITPSERTVKEGTYPIARQLYLYVNSNNQLPLIKDFIKFALSSKGQDIVKKSDYITIK